MHLTEEQLQRVLHGEATGVAAPSHLTDCSVCRAQLDRAREDESEILALLTTVDQEPQGLSAEGVALMARGRAAGRQPRRFPWAAAILLACLLGGIAYAITSTPVRSWFAKVRANPTDAPATVDSAAGREAPSRLSGIAVDPGDGLAISFEQPARGSRVQVRLADQSQVMVEAPDGAARFTSAPGRLLVTVVTDSALVQVTIPRGAPRVEIFSQGRRLLLQQGGTVEVSSPATPDGGYVIPLAP